MKHAPILVSLVTVILLLISGCGQSDSSSSDVESVPVAVTTVDLGEVVQSITYNGDISAEFEVNVYSKIPDRIQKFYVDEGDAVRKGTPVALVVATTIEQEVRRAEAFLAATRVREANLEAEYRRALRLSKEDAMSTQQFESIKTQYEGVKAQVEQAEAALAAARSQLNDATITAPISGIIGKRYYDAGDMANPGTPLVKIVQMERVKIEFDATEEDLGKLRAGQQAKVLVKAYPDRIFSGQVSKISPILDPVTRMAEVEILVNNPEKLLKPGMFARIEVTTGIIDSVMVVPRFAAIENTTLEKIDGEDQVVKNFYVFVVDSQLAVQKKLGITYANHKWLAVDSGIDIGDRLVIAGQNNLRDGVPVIITQEEEE